MSNKFDIDEDIPIEELNKIKYLNKLEILF